MSSCVGCAPAPVNKVVYGVDDRVEVEFLANDSAEYKNAECVAIMCDDDDLTEVQEDGQTFYKLATTPYTRAVFGNFGVPLRQDEPFRGQPQGGSCTGFLIGPDVLVTAGHCLTSSNMTKRRFVFGFRMRGGRTPEKYRADQVYTPTTMLKFRLDNGGDYACLRLDRTVTYCNPLAVRSAGEPRVAVNAKVYVIGHPVGLPAKFAGNGDVKSWSTSRGTFRATIDAYGGNSGSPVFNAATHKVEGILVQGATDFVISNGVAHSNFLTTNAQGETITDIARAIPQVPHLLTGVSAASSETRQFRMFVHPPYVDGFEDPEVVTFTPTFHGPITDGPKDNQLAAIDVKNYTLFGTSADNSNLEFLPPVRVEDMLRVEDDSRQFSTCQMFATVRRVIDIAENYLGGPVAFPLDADGILLLLPLVTAWRRQGSRRKFINAVSVNGTTNEMLVFGFSDHALTKPYCENFDVLAHEVGHTLVTAIMGRVQRTVPPSQQYREYLGFSESMGDTIAILTALHFDHFVDVLLTETKGNIATRNCLTNMGETDPGTIRFLLTAITQPQASNQGEHKLSESLSGGILDALLLVYYANLRADPAWAQLGLTSLQSAIDSAFKDRHTNPTNGATAQAFADAFAILPGAFVDALLTARDVVGKALFKMLKFFDGRIGDFSFKNVARVFCSHLAAQPHAVVTVTDAQRSFVNRKIIPTTVPRLLDTSAVDAADVHIAFHEHVDEHA